VARKNRLQEVANERRMTVEALMTEAFKKHGRDRDVAADIGVHVNTIKRWRRLHGVRQRTIYVVGEAQRARP
jgi:predicted DNA-binding ribbon-helix-helix protein